MFNFFSRHALPLRGARPQERADFATAVGVARRPDFDPSDFEEPMPTIPGGYWHASDEPREDAVKAF
jgi:hypothetical protein